MPLQYFLLIKLVLHTYENYSFKYTTQLKQKFYKLSILKFENRKSIYRVFHAANIRGKLTSAFLSKYQNRIYL